REFIRQQYPATLCDLVWQTVSKPAYRGCAQSNKNVIVQISIDNVWPTPNDTGIDLVNAMVTLGSPTALEVCGPASSSGIMYVSPGVEMDLQLYTGGQIILPTWGLYPGITVMGISYYPAPISIINPAGIPAWRGFDNPISGPSIPGKYSRAGDC